MRERGEEGQIGYKVRLLHLLNLISSLGENVPVYRACCNGHYIRRLYTRQIGGIGRRTHLEEGSSFCHHISYHRMSHRIPSACVCVCACMFACMCSCVHACVCGYALAGEKRKSASSSSPSHKEIRILS